MYSVYKVDYTGAAAPINLTLFSIAFFLRGAREVPEKQICFHMRRILAPSGKILYSPPELCMKIHIWRVGYDPSGYTLSMNISYLLLIFFQFKKKTKYLCTDNLCSRSCVDDNPNIFVSGTPRHEPSRYTLSMNISYPVAYFLPV